MSYIIKMDDKFGNAGLFQTTNNILCTLESLNRGHFGDDMNSADLLFVGRFSSLGGSRCIVGIILRP